MASELISSGLSDDGKHLDLSSSLLGEFSAEHLASLLDLV